MNNPITTLSRERLEEIAYGSVRQSASEGVQMARALLAAMDAQGNSSTISDDMAYAFHSAISDSSLGGDDVEEIKMGLRAAFANTTTPPAPSAPDGWKLVPVEPTIAMTEAAIDEFNEIRNMRDTYYALLEHAPAAPGGA